MKGNRFWKFGDVTAKPARSNSTAAQPAVRPVNDEPKYMAEVSVDIGTDEDALRWAEEHDPETAELLRAEEIE